MSEWNPKQSEIIKRYRNICKWSAEQRRQHREKNKEFYEKNDAETMEILKELSELRSADTDTDMTDQSDSEGFVDVLMELEDKVKQFENKDSKGNVSSNGNS